MVECSNITDPVTMLHHIYGTNTSGWEKAMEGKKHPCEPMNSSTGISLDSDTEVALDVYAYLTPAILVWGLVGNSVSLRVFTSKFMSRLSSSYYLVALSAAHMVVLLSYVLLEWLNRGLPRWPGGHRLPLVNLSGICHIFLYLSYTSRLTSVWLVVLFTMERFVVVYIPSQRRRVCTHRCAKRLIILLLIISCLLCLYKPLLSGVYQADTAHSKVGVCGRNTKYKYQVLVLDIIYALFITAIPSIIILALNLPILKRILGKQADSPGTKLVFRENRLRLELTIILLAISSCFVCLTLPYFVFWCQQFLRTLYPSPESDFQGASGPLLIARTIGYTNYCINFFLYCLTGAYYRREIKSIFRYYFKQSRATPSTTAEQEPL